jgi:hypothetical protein
MGKLRAEGDRVFAGRDHLHTAVYGFVCEVRAADGSSAATALDRPFGGVIAMAVPAGGGASGADAIVGGAVPVAAVLSPERVIMAETEAPPHDLVLGFTTGDPIDAWRALVEPALASIPDIGFASPFVRTIPGTDTYVDDL